jgi:long-chain fatty acid transport protein
MKCSHPWVTALAGTIVLVPAMLANATRLPDQDAWVMARGNAAVAGVSDAASVYYNPAGLASVKAGEVSAGMYVIAPKTEFTSATTGETVRERSTQFYQPHLFAALPVGDAFTVGVGVFSPYGQSTDWAPTSGFGGLATFNEIRYVTGELAAAWKPFESLSIGAGVQFSHTRVNLNQLTAIPNTTYVTSFGYIGRDDAISGNVGLQWRVAPTHTLGIQYQRRTDFHFHGTATLTGVLAREGDVGWVFPDNVSVGWQWQFARDWQTEVAVDWTNWDRVNTLNLQADVLSTSLPLNWKSSGYYCVGVSHDVDQHWSWAAGYIFSQNSVPESSLNPSLPDPDRHLLSAGVFWSSRSWKFEAALQRGLRNSRRRTTPQPDGLGGSGVGTYHTEMWGGDLQAVYRF